MKKKLFGCICWLLLAVTVLSSCNSQNGEKTTTVADTAEAETGGATAESLRIVENGASEYTVVYSYDVSENVFLKIQDLIDTVKSKTGVELSAKKLDKGDSVSADLPAIVIGKTACGEMQKELRRNDYILCVSGKQLMINAYEDDELLKAMTYFCQKLLPKSYQNGVFALAADYEYYREAEYVYDSMTLLNTNISEYQVVVPKDSTPYEMYAAKLIWDHLSSSTGYYIDLVTDDTPAAAHEIIVGKTNRYSASVNSYEYAIGTKEGSVWMIASDLYSYGALADYVTGELFYTEESSLTLNTVAETRKDVSGSLSEMQKQDYGEYRVLFNNILGNCDQELYPVARRNEMLLEIYKTYDPDVIGLQECSANSRSPLNSSIIDLLKGEGYAEVPVTGCSSNLYTPVLYKESRFELVESGYLLFTLNAKKDNSKSLVWAVLKDKTSGEQIAVISTHFTVYGSDEYPVEEARVGNATQLIQVVESIYNKYHCPTVIGGDLNCNVSSDAMKLLMKNSTYARTAAPLTDMMKTSHGYPTFDQELGIYTEYSAPKANATDESIDHICFFHDDNVSVNAFDVCADKYSCLSTDHCPLIVDFTIGNIS